MAFLVRGIPAQSVLSVAVFNGVSVILERDLGIVHKFLASSLRSAGQSRVASISAFQKIDSKKQACSVFEDLIPKYEDRY